MDVNEEKPETKITNEKGNKLKQMRLYIQCQKLIKKIFGVFYQFMKSLLY